MQGFVCGTVKISSAFISKALVRPKLWKNLATLLSVSPIWTTLKPTTWTQTKPEMKLGVLQKITPGSACIHTHTQIHIFLYSLTHTHIHMHLCSRHGSWSFLFLQLSISCLIRFPLGKLFLTYMGSDLTDWLIACFFFFYLSCLVNSLADGLVGC